MSRVSLLHTEPIVVPASELSDALAELRRVAPTELFLHVTDHGERAHHAETVTTTLRELRAFWGRQSSGIFMQRRANRNFVQTWLHAGKSGVYCEAVDQNAYTRGHLTHQQRILLLDLGWHDPKLRPYAPSEYQWLWDKNYACEWPLHLPGIAEHLVSTLHKVYGLNRKNDLSIKLRRQGDETGRRAKRARRALRWIPVTGRTVTAKSVKLDEIVASEGGS